jgi:putative FmdB family regulatory protein
MPIYAYKCESCGHSKDVLQKMSDAPLTDCPQCAAAAFKKQLTAAGFQLKGSGWYVTDFRGGEQAKGAESGSTEKTVAPVSSGADVAAKPAKSETTAPAVASAPAASPSPAPNAAPKTTP